MEPVWPDFSALAKFEVFGQIFKGIAKNIEPTKNGNL